MGIDLELAMHEVGSYTTGLLSHQAVLKVKRIDATYILFFSVTDFHMCTQGIKIQIPTGQTPLQPMHVYFEGCKIMQ